MQLKKVCVWKVKYLKVVHLTLVAKEKIAVVRREPVGLVLAISPFNYPVNLAGSKIAPALIAGDVVAFKPPTQVLSQVFFWLKHLLKLVSLQVS